MLERVLEPEVMDTPEEARDYNVMDHADVNRRFVDDLVLCHSLILGSGATGFASARACEYQPLRSTGGASGTLTANCDKALDRFHQRRNASHFVEPRAPGLNPGAHARSETQHDENPTGRTVARYFTRPFSWSSPRR